jgi:hypothetical protein
MKFAESTYLEKNNDFHYFYYILLQGWKDKLSTYKYILNLGKNR